MTATEAKANQERIAKDFELGWWYGVKCHKCCGVFPKFMRRDTNEPQSCYYQCEVCGRRNTECYTMPWIAEEEWNAGKTECNDQMTLDQFV